MCETVEKLIDNRLNLLHPDSITFFYCSHHRCSIMSIFYFIPMWLYWEGARLPLYENKELQIYQIKTMLFSLLQCLHQTLGTSDTQLQNTIWSFITVLYSNFCIFTPLHLVIVRSLSLSFYRFDCTFFSSGGVSVLIAWVSPPL